ncbi:MAG TPA: hypothetical protein VGI40_14480 [Pirellulaceae bacterium]|jgi:hypothetical protein
MKRHLRDIVWLFLILCTGFGWYLDYSSQNPELLKLAAEHASVNAKNELIAKQFDDRHRELQQELEKRRHTVEITWASIPRLRNERRRLERIESELKKSGKDGD